MVSLRHHLVLTKDSRVYLYLFLFLYLYLYLHLYQFQLATAAVRTSAQADPARQQASVDVDHVDVIELFRK